MPQRLPSSPPILPGLAYIRPLGSGGFADVFLYGQDMPRRDVAVKVLPSDVRDTDLLRMFNAEADVLAHLSAHPSIVTVYQAGISADGRPYIVMEFCPGSLAQRYRVERIPVAEVLSIGFQAIPTGCGPAMAAAAIIGALLAVADRLLPERVARWLPSGPALGLAFVIPAWISISLALGAVAAAVAARVASGWAARFVLAIAAGLVAERVGARATIALGGLACFAGGVWFRLKLPYLRELIRPVYAERGVLVAPDADTG